MPTPSKDPEPPMTNPCATTPPTVAHQWRIQAPQKSAPLLPDAYRKRSGARAHAPLCSACGAALAHTHDIPFPSGGVGTASSAPARAPAHPRQVARIKASARAAGIRSQITGLNKNPVICQRARFLPFTLPQPLLSAASGHERRGFRGFASARQGEGTAC
jgi:hypothetical protein